MIRDPESQLLAAERDFRQAGQPVQPGDIVVISATGIGFTSQSGAAVTVRIGGQEAAIEVIEPAGDAVAVQSIRVRVPLGTPLGERIPVQLSVLDSGGRWLASNTVTMAIEGLN